MEKTHKHKWVTNSKVNLEERHTYVDNNVEIWKMQYVVVICEDCGDAKKSYVS